MPNNIYSGLLSGNGRVGGAINNGGLYGSSAPPGQSMGGFPGMGGTAASTGNMMSELERVVPGLSRNFSSASGNINELLGGLPSPSLARNASAYMGIQSGMPGSDLIRNKGFDLYNSQSNQMKQQGLQDLLGLLGGVSGTAVATPGQALQDKQASGQLGLGYGNLDLGNRSLANNANQSNQDRQLQAWLGAGQLGIAGLNAVNNGVGNFLDFLNP